MAWLRSLSCCRQVPVQILSSQPRGSKEEGDPRPLSLATSLAGVWAPDQAAPGEAPRAGQDRARAGALWAGQRPPLPPTTNDKRLAGAPSAKAPKKPPAARVCSERARWAEGAERSWRDAEVPSIESWTAPRPRRGPSAGPARRPPTRYSCLALPAPPAPEEAAQPWAFLRPRSFFVRFLRSFWFLRG